MLSITLLACTTVQLQDLAVCIAVYGKTFDLDMTMPNFNLV